MRLKANNGALAVGGEFTWNLTTLRLKLKRKEKLEGMLAQQLTRWETWMEGIIEEKGSDNKTMVHKTAKKGKRVLRRDETSLAQLEEELGMGFIASALPKPFA